MIGKSNLDFTLSSLLFFLLFTPWSVCKTPKCVNSLFCFAKSDFSPAPQLSSVRKMSTLVFRVEHHVFNFLFAAISIFCNNPDREGRTWNSCYWRGGMRNRAAAEVNTMCVTVACVFKPFIKPGWHLTQIWREDTPTSAVWCIIFIMAREDWDITRDICYYHDSWQVCPTIQITQAYSVLVGYIHGGFVSLVSQC